ncbi:MAG: L-threonylcarbamoyladenylate synthase [Patiriisocius sp.]|jgi:L-threonylcarbamoyladenylate synthase
MNPDKMRKASDVLKEGGVLLTATDTLWGLSCDASNEKAVERIKEIKGRVEGQSFILLVNSDSMLERYVNEVPDVAWDIIDQSVRPVTIIYPRGINLPDSTFHKDGTVAIRITDDPVLMKLIQYTKKPIVSTSANETGKPAPKKRDEIASTILESVDYVLDLPEVKSGSKKASSILKIGLRGEIKIIRK